MPELKKPINKAASEKASKQFREKHPELGGRKLTMDDADAALREEWIQLYLSNGGQIEPSPLDLLEAAWKKLLKIFKKDPPAPEEPCPLQSECEDHPNLIAVEILDGDDLTVLTSNDRQYVNLPGDDKWNGGTVKNKDRQTQRPRVRVRFDRPCTENFKLKLVPGDSNSVYTATERGRSDKFNYTEDEGTYTTDADGMKIIADFDITAAGNDTYKFVAEDDYANEVQSVEIETYRRLYLQELKMTGAPCATSIDVFKAEFAKHNIEIKRFVSVPMTRIENVGASTTAFKAACRTAYNSSGCSTRQPYLVALAYTDHLALKETLDVSKSGVEVGPGKPAVNIPIVDAATNNKSLWLNLVTGESWYVSAKFRKNGGTAADDVEIAEGLITPVPIASNPNSYKSVDVNVETLTTEVETGTISLEVNAVKSMRGGISLSGNLICVCTRSWWRDISTQKQNDIMVHELGHKIGMVSNGTSLDTTSLHYTAHGHKGDHCHKGLALTAAEFTDAQSSSSTCTMFGATNGHSDFCDVCAPAVKKIDLSGGWGAF